MSLRTVVTSALMALTFAAALFLPSQRPRDAGADVKQSATASKHELAVCSGEEVFIVAFNYDPAKKGEPILATRTWHWRARGQEDIPKKFHTSFVMTSECKPVDGGKKLIIAAKEGGIALVDRETTKTLFCTVMPHRGYSGELLPNDRIAVVSGDEKGGSISIFNLKAPDRPFFQQTLIGAKGIAYDAQREQLWVLGMQEMRLYSLASWRTAQASLKLEQTFKLPEEDGGDLHLIPGGKELLLATAHGLYQFDTERQRFTPHQTLGARDHIKSTSVHPVSKLLAYVHPDGASWWSDRVKLSGGEKDLLFPNAKVYKARWVTSE